MDEIPERASGKHRFRPPQPLPRRRMSMTNPKAEEILVIETETFLARWELEKYTFMRTMDYMLQAAAHRPPIGNWP